jgi:5-methylcytosine-specific restriction endonuclease McrA
MRYDDILTDEQLHRYTQQFNLRARKYNQPALPLALIRDRILESAGQCEWCGDNLVGKDFELDHVVSLRQGGQHQANNLVVACPDCNRRKAEKAPLQFALEIVARKGKNNALGAKNCLNSTKYKHIRNVAYLMTTQNPTIKPNHPRRIPTLVMFDLIAGKKVT